MGYQLRPLNEKFQVESTIHVRRLNRGEKVIRTGESPPEPPGRIPRISRMMALAIWFDELIRNGEVKNFAKLAALRQVCRTRVTQIMNLLLLAPDIYEELLFLPRVEKGADAKDLQPASRTLSWENQRRRWQSVQAKSVANSSIA